jgi:hypothetical protein
VDEGARFRQLFGAIDRRIDFSPQAVLNRSKCGEQVRQLYPSDNHEIDVAGRCVLPSGDRTINEGNEDLRFPRQLREPCSQHIGDTSGFREQAAHLAEDG